MSTQTEHLKLDLREASDIFNPMSTNANFKSLDNIIYDIQTKGGVPTYTTTASANLLKLSQNPTPNVTVFKFVAADDANTWSYQETVNDIVTLDGSKKTVKGGEMYVAWVNAANAMVVIAWPDVVNAQTFDGKGPAEWASKAQLDAVNQTAVNATQTAQAAATVANSAMLKGNVLLSGNYKKEIGTDLYIPASIGNCFAYTVNITGTSDNIDVGLFSTRFSTLQYAIGRTSSRVVTPNFNLVFANISFTTTDLVIGAIYKYIDGSFVEIGGTIKVSVSLHTQQS